MDNNFYRQELIALNKSNNQRVLSVLDLDLLHNISSNDYLGIASDKVLRKEFYANVDIQKLSFASASSRLLTGNHPYYEKIENLIASSYSRESCLFYNSGYHANIGILPALAGKGDLIIADKNVHASCIDGILLSKADFRRYRHLDLVHLESILKKERNNYDKIFIVSESIYSMDGAIADIHSLVKLKQEYNTYLYIDEAHAVGVCGENGYGVVESISCINDVDFIVGTFGKALASVGAYVVCDDIIKQYLVNKSRSLIYTTALAPITMAWNYFVFSKLPSMNNKRIALRKLISLAEVLLKKKKLTHIIPYILGDNSKAIECSEYLKNEGFYVSAIKHPTVAKNKSQIRISLCVDLEYKSLEYFFKILIKYKS